MPKHRTESHRHSAPTHDDSPTHTDTESDAESSKDRRKSGKWEEDAGQEDSTDDDGDVKSKKKDDNDSDDDAEDKPLKSSKDADSSSDDDDRGRSHSKSHSRAHHQHDGNSSEERQHAHHPHERHQNIPREKHKHHHHVSKQPGSREMMSVHHGGGKRGGGVWNPARVREDRQGMRDWQFGLVGCCDAQNGTNNFLCACCCSPCVFQQISSRFETLNQSQQVLADQGFGSYFGGQCCLAECCPMCAFFFEMTMRGQMREKFHIRGSTCDDLMMNFCCFCLVATQEMNELDTIEAGIRRMGNKTHRHRHRD
ncbi:hypothetical protein T439DRAFT_383635 [Meredithblackwellia eburnea MCA 4105]